MWCPALAIGYDPGRFQEGRRCLERGRPANHGASSHGLRGDYGRMRPDYTVEQDHAAYSEPEHDRWRRLYRRQIDLVPGGPAPSTRTPSPRSTTRPHPPLRGREPAAQCLDRWRLVAVPVSCPISCSSSTSRTGASPSPAGSGRDEFDYIVEPDVFHDFSATCPCSSTPCSPTTWRPTGRAASRRRGSAR